MKQGRGTWRAPRIGMFTLIALVGCSGGAPDLVVDLRTDLRPGYDFDEVRTRVLEAPSTSARGWERVTPVTRGDDFVAGRRVAELIDVEVGDYTLEVMLLDAGVELAARRVSVRVESSRSVTAVITSDCAGVSCPGLGDPLGATECVGRRCVEPACTPDHPEACPAVVCQDDAECESAGACLIGRCVAGDCFQQADDGACASGEYCDIELGCLSIPALPDAGPVVRDGGPTPVDAGPTPVDAGPVSCVPSDCSDSDPCTDDECSAGTCLHSPTCGTGTYCVSGSCYPLPAISITARDGTDCVDLGVAHPSGSNYTFRRVTSGRPGRTATQTNEHASCGEAAMDADMFALDGAGNDTYSFYSGALSNCWDGIYGLWRVRVRVDGRTSPPDDVVYYNSTCSNVRTCSAARSFCSPCDCAWSTEYCYSGASCAPKPTLTIETSNGPGCVDLGVAHSSPPAINVIVDGRPFATSTQYNEHASCSGSSPAAADVRALGATGHVEDPLPTGAITNCADSIYGLWNVYMSVDGELSNTVGVVYYNSTCSTASGVRTCAAARTACL